jgi:acetamidase/formamidase
VESAPRAYGLKASNAASPISTFSGAIPRGKFQFIVRKDMKITWPRAETPTHWMVMGLNPNLEEAMKMAVRETILFLTERFPKLSREEAYMIASVAVDYHVTQVVDGTKGIHGMIPKAIFTTQ